MVQKTVLVTGGSGFIAGHIMLQLLAAGHRVRTTVRSRTREPDVRAVLAAAGLVDSDALTFVEADLTDNAGWPAAVDGIDHVLHVASPVHLGAIENEDDVIVPARDGALRVLRAARDAGVERVVLTSAFHAVGFGHGQIDHTFTEDDWSVLDGPGMDAYGRSKVLAERAAWDFVHSEGGSMQLTTLLPVAVMGPVMGHDISGANHVIQRILNGALPAFPNTYFPIVDVRDVAAAHIAAMTAPDAADQRILVASGRPAVAMKDIGALLKEHFGDAAKHVPTESIPDDVVRAAAEANPEFRSLVPELGYAKKVSAEKMTRVLGLTPRKPEVAIIDAGASMIANGLVTE